VLGLEGHGEPRLTPVVILAAVLAAGAIRLLHLGPTSGVALTGPLALLAVLIGVGKTTTA
jgi:hypothetical protein